MQLRGLFAVINHWSMPMETQATPTTPIIKSISNAVWVYRADNKFPESRSFQVDSAARAASKQYGVRSQAYKTV